ncbi:hypothetical protein V1478_004525 [Vespula squamosa]|uniref:Uncharacterized protein n=1 Tax=Vespula squamosa TaxID=30214 RepID=A0ABD2BGF2_VESSQ
MTMSRVESRRDEMRRDDGTGRSDERDGGGGPTLGRKSRRSNGSFFDELMRLLRADGHRSNYIGIEKTNKYLLAYYVRFPFDREHSFLVDPTFENDARDSTNGANENAKIKRMVKQNLINSPSAIGPVKTFYDVGMYVGKLRKTFSNVDNEFDFFCRPQLDYRSWNTLMSTNIIEKYRWIKTRNDSQLQFNRIHFANNYNHFVGITIVSRVLICGEMDGVRITLLKLSKDGNRRRMAIDRSDPKEGTRRGR